MTPRFDHPVNFTGPGTRMWEHTFYEAGPGIIAAGASSPEEMDHICRQLCELTIATDTLIGQRASRFCRAIKP